MTREVYFKFFVEKVYPAIRKKWPKSNEAHVQVIQGNAPAHVNPSNQEITESRALDENKLELLNKPPNSPDYNILDLGFFRSIQEIQYTASSKDLNELIEVVCNAF